MLISSLFALGQKGLSKPTLLLIRCQLPAWHPKGVKLTCCQMLTVNLSLGIDKVVLQKVSPPTLRITTLGWQDFFLGSPGLTIPSTSTFSSKLSSKGYSPCRCPPSYDFLQKASPHCQDYIRAPFLGFHNSLDQHIVVVHNRGDLTFKGHEAMSGNGFGYCNCLGVL